MEELKFHTETRIINDLIPYEYNPRKLSEKHHALLEASLKKFGIAEIPVVDVDNVIIAGHQRLAIMKALGRGDEQTDVRVPNRKLTEEEFKEYLISSNKIKGDWDHDMLSSVFELEDLKLWGFTDIDLGLSDVKQTIKNSEIEIGDLTLNKGKMTTCPNCQHEYEL